MLQADFFWTFALGSSFAAAASKQLQAEEHPFDNKNYSTTLFIVGLFVLPAVIYLTIVYPGWETMYVLYPYLVDVNNSIFPKIPLSAGLVIASIIVVFFLTSTLGFYFTFKFIKNDNMKGAHLLWVIGYFMTFFIMFVGWDGSAWERMTYAGTWHEWHQWKVLGGSNSYVWKDFLSTPIFRDLMVMVFVVLPPVGYVYLKWPKAIDIS